MMTIKPKRFALHSLAWMVRCLCLFFILYIPLKGAAHQFNFVSLTISEKEENEYTVYFRYSASKASLESSRIRLPASCLSNAVVNDGIAVNSLSIRYTVRCKGNLLLELQGIDPNAMIYVQYEDARSGVHFERMTFSPSIDLASLKLANASSTALSPHASYFLLGIEHILTGIDHLMVVFCYVCIFGLRRKLFFVITAFTVGHSVTLVLSAFQLIRVHVPPIEACIALSIIFLVRDMITQRQGTFTLLAATFIGLIHGLGFAAALGETLAGLKGNTVVSYHWFDLFQFNLGIEFGQVMFIVACFICTRLMGMVVPTAWRNQPTHQWISMHGSTIASVLIGSAAVFMLFERMSTWAI